MPTIKCLLKRTYGYEDVVWRISRWLFSSDIWMEWFNLYQVSMLHDASHQVSAQENIWVGRSCLKNSKKAVYCMTIFCIWVEWKKHIWVSFWPDYPIKFLLKRINGLEEVVWKIPRRLFIAWPSFVSEWNERSISECFLAWHILSSFCSWGHTVWKVLFEDFHDGGLMLGPLWHLKGMILAFLCSLSAWCLPSSFCSRRYMVLKIMMFEEIQDVCLVLGNLWYAIGWF